MVTQERLDFLVEEFKKDSTVLFQCIVVFNVFPTLALYLLLQVSYLYLPVWRYGHSYRR